MKPTIIKTLVSVVAILGAIGVARAEIIGLYECTNVGAVGEDAIGDRAGHNLISVEYICTGVDGVLKGASHLGTAVTEWSDRKGTWISAVGVTRKMDGLAVAQALEGAGTAVIKDGKFIGVEASGKAVFKFASGSLAGLSARLTTGPASRHRVLADPLLSCRIEGPRLPAHAWSKSEAQEG